MAKKSKSKIGTKKNQRRAPKRQERRFVSQSGTNTTLVRGLGAVSALVLGAGTWAYFSAQSFVHDEGLKQLPSYLIAGGAVLLGITIWIGTSGDNPMRVGDPGIAIEKGELRRMPWWAVERITFESGAVALVVTGKDEANVDWTFKVSLKSHPEAGGWILREALDRIPRRVDIPEDTLEKLPGAGEHAGQRLDLEPLQVVGKRCAITGKTISYEPDARVCPRCERVYQKQAVPKKCKCGNSLVHLRPKSAEDGPEENEVEETDGDDDRRSPPKIEAAEEETAES
jgi:predicted ribosomally synthesized peptide with SipW-like signal peptide